MPDKRYNRSRERYLGLWEDLARKGWLAHESAGVDLLPGVIWCSLCERAYPAGRMRVFGYVVLGYRMLGCGQKFRFQCGYWDCQASTHGPGHWYGWSKYQPPRRSHPEYPEAPEMFGYYPDRNTG